MYQTKYDFADEDFCWKYLTNETFHNEKAIKQYNGNLYHYTTPQGLIGILENQKLWATEFSFLNDASELSYGMNLSIEVLENEICSHANTILDKYLLLVEDLIKKKKDINPYFVTSFSEYKDLLSQWKGYGQNGQGFSLGFDLKELSRWKRKDILDVNYYIQPVIYNCEEQKNELKNIYKNLIEHIFTLETKGILTDEKLEEIASSSVALMKLKSIFFKSEFFQEEKEWRIVCRNFYRNVTTWELEQEKVKFRFIGSKIIPYVELDILPEKSLLPIKEIIIGTKNNNHEINKIISYSYTNAGQQKLIPELE